jgi:hypothetical protein
MRPRSLSVGFFGDCVLFIALKSLSTTEEFSALQAETREKDSHYLSQDPLRRNTLVFGAPRFLDLAKIRGKV